MKIKKTKLNLTIDLWMFIVMMPIAGIGFLIKYVLVPGFKRNEIYGSDVELYYCGIDRHQWGTIHLTLSIILLFLLLLHIVFHWKQIVCILKTMIHVRALRIILGFLLVLFTIVFGILPLFITPEVEEGVSHHAHNMVAGKGFRNEIKQQNKQILTPLVVEQTQELTSSAENQKIFKYTNQSEIEIFGNMTINEVAKKYHVSAQELTSFIKVPAGNNNERLGRLRKRYNFQLNDLRKYIESKTTKE